MFNFKKDEKYYIEMLLSMNKECWKSNMSERDTWVKLKKYLKKIKLNSKDHPFLYNLREKSVYINSNDEIRESLIELYDYKRKINKSI